MVIEQVITNNQDQIRGFLVIAAGQLILARKTIEHRNHSGWANNANNQALSASADPGDIARARFLDAPFDLTQN